MAYDDNGNVIKKSKGALDETWTYEYDHNDRLIEAEKRATDGGILEMAATYGYDAFGQRIEKEIWDGSTTVTRFTYDNGQVLFDLNGSSSLTDRYLLGATIFNRFARISSAGEASWLLADRLGSVYFVTNETGAILSALTYDGYGKTQSESSPSDSGDYLYALYRLDRETGLYLPDLSGRHYDPSTGRWYSEDDIRIDGPNLYPYVRNNPTNGTDPSGQYLVISEDEKRVISTYFGDPNVEYIIGDSGMIKVVLKPSAKDHFDDYVVDSIEKSLKRLREQGKSPTELRQATQDAFSFSDALWKHASDSASGYTLEGLVANWSEMQLARTPTNSATSGDARSSSGNRIVYVPNRPHGVEVDDSNRLVPAGRQRIVVPPRQPGNIRLQGLGKATFGALEIVTIVGAPHGIDMFHAGAQQAITGKETETMTHKGARIVLSWFGIDEKHAWLVETTVSLGLAGYGAWYKAWKKETVETILTADRVGSGLKQDVTHRAASFVTRDQLMKGQVYKIRGNDGVTRTLLQTEGELNGNRGIFEYIVNENRMISHQRFIKGGRITGAPNQPAAK